MTEGALLAFGVIVAFFAEGSFVHALPPPLSAFPLATAVAILIAHLVGKELGALAFVALALLAFLFGIDAYGALPYVVAAAATYALCAQVFTTRSTFALLGLGVAVEIALRLTMAALSLAFLLAHRTADNPLRNVAAETILLLAGLYIGARIVYAARRWYASSFIVRS